MKNIFKLIAIMVIAVLTAVSCAQPLEEAELDWTDANKSSDPTLNSGQSSYGSQLWNQPSVTASKIETTTVAITSGTYDGVNQVTLNGYDVTVTFPNDADILRGTIDAAAINKVISFHNFTIAAEDNVGVASTLSAALTTVQVVSRNDRDVRLWIPVSGVSYYDGATAAKGTYTNLSPLVMKVGSGYTYKHGFKLDVDGNGLNEDGYDDVYVGPLTNTDFIRNTGLFPTETQQNTIGSFEAPGQKNWRITLNTLPITSNSPGAYIGAYKDADAATAAVTANSAPDFYFTGNANTTNSARLVAAQINLDGISSLSFDPDRTASTHNIFRAVGNLFASEIKLQSFKGGSWSNAGGTAVVAYDTEADPDNLPQGYYIVLQNVSFERDIPYRIVWEGDGAKKTSAKYFGIEQYVYVDAQGITAPSGWTKYTDKKVEGNPQTYENQYSASYKTYFNSVSGLTVQQIDSNNQNIVLSIKLNGYFWNEVSLTTIQENFKIGYSRSNNGSNYYGITDLVNIDIVDIKFVDPQFTRVSSDLTEQNPPQADQTKGFTTLLITLDPNYKKPEYSIPTKYFWINDKLSVFSYNWEYAAPPATSTYVKRTTYFGGNEHIHKLYDGFRSYNVGSSTF